MKILVASNAQNIEMVFKTGIQRIYIRNIHI